MAYFNIEDLPKAPPGFDPSQHTTRIDGIVRFETLAAAEREDAFRVSALRSQLKHHPRSWEATELEAIKDLITNIENAAGPASSRYMRKLRKRIAGHAWKLIASSKEPVTFFTVIPRSWEFFGGELKKADPALLKDQFRKAVAKESGLKPHGWLIAGLHGEHEPSEDVYRIHIHGVASGDMISAVDRLRSKRHFKSERKVSKRQKVYQRLRMTRKPLNNLPEPVTYIVQSFWPSKAIYGTFQDPRRQTCKHRIREPRHTEVLLWLSRTGLRDLTVLMGLKVNSQGLKRS